MSVGGGMRAARRSAAKAHRRHTLIVEGATEAERERQAAFIESRSARLRAIGARGGNQHIGADEARALARHLAVIAQDVRIGLHDEGEPARG